MLKPPITDDFREVNAWRELVSQALNSTFASDFSIRSEIIIDTSVDQIQVGSNIVIDGANEKIYIGDSLYGNQGIQLEYNSGSPRIHAGDGSTHYFKFDGEYGFMQCGDVLIDGENQRVRSTNYVSGFLGSGFTLQSDLLEVGNARIRGALQCVTFETQTVHAYGGALVVVKGADVLASDMTAADAQDVVIENKSGANSWSVGDLLRMTASDGAGSVDSEWLEVTAVDGNTYTVTRDKAGTYGADSNPAWTEGTSITNWGQSGDGGVAIWGYGSGAPYMQVFTIDSTPWSGYSTWGRFGNLNGSYGISNDYYGIGIGAADKSGHYLIWDHNSGTLDIKGSITVTGGDAFSKTSDDLDDIIAGTVFKKTSTGGNLLNNFSVTNSTTGWDNGHDGLTTTTKDGETVRVLEITTDGDVQIMSDAVEVDPSQMYRVTLSIKGDPTDGTTGTRYFGLFTHDENDNLIENDRFVVASRTYTTSLTNTYFWFGDIAADTWRDMVAYILPHDASIEEIPKGKNVTFFAKMKPNAAKIRIRFLNYDNSGTETTNYFYSPSVVAVAGASTDLADTDGDLDDIGDGTTYARVNATYISAGKVVTAGSSGSDAVLDGANGKIYINSGTYGNDGIQLDYNSGNPRFYCGNGSNDYIKFDGTNVELSTSKSDALVIKSGADIKLESATGGAAGNIKFVGDSRTYNFGVDYDNDYFALYPDTNGLGHFFIGRDETNTSKYFHRLEVDVDDQILLYVDDGTNTAAILAVDDPYVGLACSDGSNNGFLDVFPTYTRVQGDLRPLGDSAHSLGTSSYCWTEVYADDTSINTCSMRIVKDNICAEPLGLNFINALQPVEFTKKTKPEVGRMRGFIIEDIEAVLDEIGYKDKFAGIRTHEDTDKKHMVYGELFSPIVKAIQELDQKVESLREGK